MSEYQLMAKQCKCCGKHVPLPTSLKNFNGIAVCPTTYYNIIEYKKICESLGRIPPGKIRKHFSEYVKQIVQESISNDK